jgi:hypothetical protein
MVFSSTDFSLWGFVPATWAAQAKINRKAHGLKFTLPASWKWRIEDQKTCTLEHHKDAPPKIQNRSKAGAPATRPVQETLRNILPVEAAEEYIFSKPVETHGRPDRNLEGSYEK